MGVGALAGLGVATVGSVKAASDLGEQINKTGVVFRGSEKDIHAWARTTAGAFGISQRAALEAAGTFGNMLVPMGTSRKEAAKMSKAMVELAADMASFNNASPEETLDALRAGLAGETEPLRRFGVFLNEDRIKAEALALGLIKAKVNTEALATARERVTLAAMRAARVEKEYGRDSEEARRAQLALHQAELQVQRVLDGKVGKLTAAQKAQATYSLITKDTTDAQGDFAATSDSVANQQRILKARFEDVAAELGQQLLPVATEFGLVLQRLIGFTSRHSTETKILAGVIGGLAVLVVSASAAVRVASAATAAWTAGQWLLNAALTANPIGLVIVAVAGLAAGLVIAYNKSEAFRNIVDSAWDKLRGLGGYIAGGFARAKDTAVGAFDDIREAAQKVATVLGKIVAAIRWLIEKIPSIPKLPDINPFGSENVREVAPPSVGFTTPVAGVTSKLWDEVGIGNAMGLRVSSGLRPGDPGDHGRGHAIDMVGSRAAMAAFATATMGRYGVKDVIYGELPYWQDNGARINTWAGNEGLRASHAGQNAHVHVSAFDRGGWLAPRSATLAINNTPYWEPVGPPGARGGDTHLHFHVNGVVGMTVHDLAVAAREALNRVGIHNGSSGIYSP